MKINRLAFVGLTTLLALTGCAFSNTPGVPSTSTTPTPGSSSSSLNVDPNEKVTISIWTTYNDTYQTIINNCIEEFQKTHPNVTIENTKQTGSYDDLKNMVIDGFAVDNYPDIVAAYPDSVADFINRGKALDITRYMEDPTYGWSAADLEDIPYSYIEAGQMYSIPGTYSLPGSKSTEAMYYNQDVLIGLDLSGVDATINGGRPLNDEYIQSLSWEELFEKLVPALDAYDKKQPEGKKIIDRTTFEDWAWVGYDSDDNFFITLAKQYGYDYTAINEVTGKGEILFDNQGMKDLMKKFTGYQKNHYFTTKGIINTNVNYRSTADAMLFSIGSTGGVKYQFSADNPHNVGVAPIPHAEGKELKIISQGPDLAFLNHKDEARALAAWEFYKLFTSTEFNTAWALQTGYSPVRYSVLETEDYIDYCDANSKDNKSLDRLTALNAEYAGKVTNNLFTSPVFKGSSEARNQVSTIFAACVASTNLDAEIDTIFKTAVDNTKLKM